MPERKKLLLRLDPQVYDAVARWAADDLRSVNGQIEFALRLALRQAGRAVTKEPASEEHDPVTKEPASEEHDPVTKEPASEVQDPVSKGPASEEQDPEE